MALNFTATAAECAEEESVLVFGDKNIAHAIQEFENILIEFYNCKALALNTLKQQ